METISHGLRRMLTTPARAALRNFLMSKTDQYGQHTTYYVPHKTMLRDLDNLPTELEIFEGNVALHRQMEEGEFGEEGEEGEEGEGEEWGEEDERL